MSQEMSQGSAQKNQCSMEGSGPNAQGCKNTTTHGTCIRNKEAHTVTLSYTHCTEHGKSITGLIALHQLIVSFVNVFLIVFVSFSFFSLPCRVDPTPDTHISNTHNIHTLNHVLLFFNHSNVLILSPSYFFSSMKRHARIAENSSKGAACLKKRQTTEDITHSAVHAALLICLWDPRRLRLKMDGL